MSETREIQNSARELLSFIFLVIYKHKIRIVITFFLIASTGITFSRLTSRDIYEASAKLLLKSGRENVYSVPTATSNGPVIVDSQRDGRINSEMELLQTRHLIEKVIQDIGIEKIYPKSAGGFSFAMARAKKLTPLETIKKTNRGEAPRAPLPRGRAPGRARPAPRGGGLQRRRSRNRGGGGGAGGARRSKRGDGGGGGGCFRAPAAARRGPSPGRRRVQPEPPS